MYDKWGLQQNDYILVAFSTPCYTYYKIVGDFSCDKYLPTVEEIEEQKRILKDLEDYLKKGE